MEQPDIPLPPATLVAFAELVGFEVWIDKADPIVPYLIISPPTGRGEWISQTQATDESQWFEIFERVRAAVARDTHSESDRHRYFSLLNGRGFDRVLYQGPHAPPILSAVKRRKKYQQSPALEEIHDGNA